KSRKLDRELLQTGEQLGCSIHLLALPDKRVLTTALHTNTEISFNEIRRIAKKSEACALDGREQRPIGAAPDGNGFRIKRHDNRSEIVSYQPFHDTDLSGTEPA